MAEDDTVDAKSTEEEQNTVLSNAEDGGNQPVVAAADAPDDAENGSSVEPAADVAEPQREDRSIKALSPKARKVVSWFAACGRCSFFLVGYRLTCSGEVWETAVAQRKKNWLILPWSHAAANLVYKTYGRRIDIGCFHYEGQCSECHRRFVFEAGEDGPDSAEFRIELIP